MNLIISYPYFCRSGSPVSPSRSRRVRPAYPEAVLQTLSPSYDSIYQLASDSLLPYTMVEVAGDKGLLACTKRASKIEAGRCLVKCLVGCLVRCLTMCLVKCLDRCQVRCLEENFLMPSEMPCHTHIRCLHLNQSTNTIMNTRYPRHPPPPL